MLNMNNTLIYTALSLLVAFMLSFALTVHFWVYAGIVAISLSLFVYGSATVCSGFYLPVLCSGRTREKLIALSFDDGPDPSVTPALLDVMMEHKIQAAFFCIGSKVQANQELLKRMDVEGHLIGNHSYSHHYWFDLFSMKKMKIELQKTQDAIFQATGKRTYLFRPPYGVTNPNLARAAGSLGYIAVGWSLKSRDTVLREKESLLERLKRKIRPGDILLFHDTSEHMEIIIKDLIEWSIRNKYRIVRLDQILHIKAYE
jgi:peptidoglycan/xylan/chitin deacetylase (PgdA/CDA1 family)